MNFDPKHLKALLERLRAVAGAWCEHVEATTRTNAAIPAMEATRAEREVYLERYRKSEEAKRNVHAVATGFAKWAADHEAADLIERMAGADHG